MQLQVQGRNVDVTPKVRDYVEKRLARLSRQLDAASDVRVDLGHEHTRSQGERYSAQITTHRNRAILRAEMKDPDLFTAIDNVVDKMDRQIGRFKDKRRKNYMHQDAALKAVLGSAVPEPAEVEGEEEVASTESEAIVRTKRFAMSPMDAQEAIEQMELLGHDFYVFFNPETASVNVVYRRTHGDYGLLQPEMA